ncbi:MAG: tripartite tricarboxylate transporter permease [Candidatus Heteroscillospira sp.]|jgi:putative tricarboxylic transport membrane protein
MELLHNLAVGFSVCADPIVLLYCFIGVVSGVIIGALPGLGPSTGIAILLPLTYGMDPVAGIVMLAGIYYGAMYGGSITAILINTPGDSAAVMTTLDGYPMAVNGRPAQAMGMAAYASIIGGTVSVVIFMLLAPKIAEYALAFSPAEYFALMVMGLTSIAGMTGDDPFKGFVAAGLGLFVSTIGLDAVLGTQRFVFGVVHLYGGIDFIPVAMGLFGIAEIIYSSAQKDAKKITITREELRFRRMFPTWQEWGICLPHIARGTVLGFFVGVLPGAGATIASFLSYDMARKTSKRGELFGTGVIEGVAAPESANNAASMGAMVPMLTLGVPGSGATAIMMGALMMFGMTPGPYLFEKEPDFAWGLIASMYIGNLILLLLVVCALPLFVTILKVRPGILNGVVIGFIIMGSYALGNSLFDVGITVFFGAVGFIFKKLKIPAAPMVLAIVLGYITETNLRQAMIMAKGNFFAVISRPISAVIMVIALLLAFGTPIKNVIGRLRAHKTTV